MKEETIIIRSPEYCRHRFYVDTHFVEHNPYKNYVRKVGHCKLTHGYCDNNDEFPSNCPLNDSKQTECISKKQQSDEVIEYRHIEYSVIEGMSICTEGRGFCPQARSHICDTCEFRINAKSQLEFEKLLKEGGTLKVSVSTWENPTCKKCDYRHTNKCNNSYCPNAWEFD